MTSKILAASVLAFIFAGCATDGQRSATGSSAGADRVPTAGAVRAKGDVVPSRLVSVAIPSPADRATINDSDVLLGKLPFAADIPNRAIVAHDVHRTMKGDASNFVLYVDNPDGARVIVHPLDPRAPLPTVHLVEVATGNRLDLARDESNDINVEHHLNPGTDWDGRIRDGHDVAPPRVQAPLAVRREAGFEQPFRHTRILSFDRPFQGGAVRVEVPAGMASAGIFVELQQEKSHYTLTAVADENTHAFGDVAEISATLMRDGTPINTGTFDGTIELPNHEKLAGLSFTPQGNGKWTAQVPVSSADPKYIGVWNIKVHALGTDGPVQFERDAEAAFGFHPAHAQMTHIGVPVVARGADHLVDGVSVDVDVETLVEDRFAVRGILTYTAPDGSEHPLASAETGQVLPAGHGTVTLRFDAASLAPAGVDGPFHLRDVTLVSHAFGITQHRIGRALELATPRLAASEIRRPAKLSLRAQDMIRNGDLPKQN